MLKLKLQYFGHLIQITDSFEKTLMLGKIEGKRRRGWQRMRWLDTITNSMGTNLSNSGRQWRTEEPGVLQSMGSQRAGHDLAAAAHARLPCPSPSPRACSNLCPWSWWYHPTISSSVIPFSSCLQSFPASGSSPVSQFFASCGQRIGVSASALVFPMNIQDWFPLGLTDLISLQSKGLSRVFSNTTVQKHQFFNTQLYL